MKTPNVDSKNALTEFYLLVVTILNVSRNPEFQNHPIPAGVEAFIATQTSLFSLIISTRMNALTPHDTAAEILRSEETPHHSVQQDHTRYPIMEHTHHSTSLISHWARRPAQPSSHPNSSTLCMSNNQPFRTLKIRMTTKMNFPITYTWATNPTAAKSPNPNPAAANPPHYSHLHRPAGCGARLHHPTTWRHPLAKRAD